MFPTFKKYSIIPNENGTVTTTHTIMNQTTTHTIMNEEFITTNAEASDKAVLLTPKGTLTIGEEYSSPSISFYKNNEVEDVITIKYTKFMYKGEEVKDLQTIYDIIKSLTSIKLPSDEEINEKANSLQDEKDGDLYNEGINEGFYLGVEYMQQQILNQNK
jgi:hypothetical protein